MIFASARLFPRRTRRNSRDRHRPRLVPEDCGIRRAQLGGVDSRRGRHVLLNAPRRLVGSLSGCRAGPHAGGWSPENRVEMILDPAGRVPAPRLQVPVATRAMSRGAVATPRPACSRTGDWRQPGTLCNFLRFERLSRSTAIKRPSVELPASAAPYEQLLPGSGLFAWSGLPAPAQGRGGGSFSKLKRNTPSFGERRVPIQPQSV